MKDTHTDSDKAATAPSPMIKKKSGFSLVWLIPIITALIGGWLIFKTLSEKGPDITITFKTAEGIEAGKTKIKYKEIEIGVVDSVHFSKDFSHIIVKASMEKGSQSFLRRGTRFWVVNPRLSLRGASGLGTLFSGAFIEIEPGQGASQKRFVGLDVPPVIKADVTGIKIVLLAKKLGSIDSGSPVYYHGILAGETLGWELGNDQKSIFIHVFVKAPYDKLVQSNTRFWNVSGVDVSVGSEGISVRTESFHSLLYGGIAFETPDTLEQVNDNVEGLVFTLYDDHKSIQEQFYTKKITFILFFDGSVRGLNVDAPVEFKGIKVGSVKDIRLEFDSSDTTFRIPVLIEVEPERVIERGKDRASSPFQTLQTLVDRGLRARLQSGSLLTGKLFVELDMHPGTPIRLVNEGGPYPELPTIPASLAQMTASLKGILAKLEKVDMERIGVEFLETLKEANKFAKGASDFINKPELQDVVEDLSESLNALKDILRKLDQRVEPIAENLEKAIGAGHQALEKARVTIGLVDDVLKPDSPLQYRFIELTEELAETARSIRALVDLLERNPNALIFGKDPSGDK
ncbi:MAG: MCE family protein [Deltaproteobacteria bacterium]|nr:MCE family protein [Deltaproteobacteria bacterium]